MRRAPRQAKQTRTRRTGCGCSGLGTFLILLLIAGAFIGWPIYLKNSGAQASAVITDKIETVRIRYGNWFRRFEIIAAYTIPGQSLEHRATCDVDETTFDSLHRGDRVTVYYFANLLNQPFLPATHLSSCTSMVSIGSNPLLMRPAITSLVALLAILFLWRVFRIRVMMWLLLPWFCLTAAYVLLPRAEPEPQHPVSATATVDNITTVTTVGGMERYRDLPLLHPYQIVRLTYLPAGMDLPVVAIDKIDAGSVPNLKQGQKVSVVYDAEHRRIARLEGGTRSFPGQARTIVIVVCVIFIVLVLGLALLRALFRLPGRFLRRV